MVRRRKRVEALVAYLCSRECAGRRPGTPEGAAAQERIVSELTKSRVEPAGKAGYLQRVPGCGDNILARVPGMGALAERAVLVAAHYDHLGRFGHREAFWGADDNAAAVAILLDLARELSSPGESARQIVLAFFDGEEPPHFLGETMGSVYYAKHPTVPLEKTDAMVCMDLVGHTLGPAHFPEEVRKTLFVMGSELSHGTPAIVDKVAERAQGIFPRRLSLDLIPPMSDYYAFARERVPVLFLTCLRWKHYHSLTDTPDKLDYDKIMATSDFLRDLVKSLAIRPDVPVAFLHDGHDDSVQIETLLALTEQLEPHIDEIARFGPILQRLAASADRGSLDADERDQVGQLVMELETHLADDSTSAIKSLLQSLNPSRIGWWFRRL